MGRQVHEFQNILVVHFGQMGDVVLGLPALRAIRDHFRSARITTLVGKAAGEVVKLAGVSDDQIVVDRQGLRKDNTLRSLRRIYDLVREVRKRRFDLVIDLHSLSETNILGFLSGAPSRLYSNREGRSLDILGNFREKPAREDKSKHLVDRYLDVVAPLGIRNADRMVRFMPPKSSVDRIRGQYFNGSGSGGKNYVGMFPGAGHPSRQWPLSNFAQLARTVSAQNYVPVVFLGPEEESASNLVRSTFPDETIIVEKLDVSGFIAAVSNVEIFVGNDTGPVHLAAAAGVPVVLLLDARAPKTYLPLSDNLNVVSGAVISEITVGQVLASVASMLPLSVQ